MVTVVGTNFGATNTNPSITIGGRPCLSVVWLSDTKLQCVAPPGVGVGDVRVFVLDQSSPENFGTVFEFDAPLVKQLVPDHGPCAGGYLVTIEGLNFGTTNSKPKITLGGISCEATAWISDKQVTCTAPKGSGSDKQVVVEILGQASKPDAVSSFSYDGPRIDKLAPPNGPTIGGTEVTIIGENFGSKDAGKDMSVKVGNIPCSAASWESETSVTCVIPPGIGPTNQVIVAFNGLTSPACDPLKMANCHSAFRYDKPLISAVTPNHGPTTGGFFVDLPGDNYGTSPTSLKLSVGKQPCEKSQWVSNTMAKCRVPAGVGITHVIAQVEGQQSDGATLDSDVFSYDRPLVRTVSPSRGNPVGGQLVTLDGTNFGTQKDQAQVLVGDIPARIVHVSDNRILMVLPPGEGQQDLSVRVADQVSAQTPGEAVPAIAYSGPRLTAVVPNHGPTQGGQVVTLTGRDLGTSSSKLEVDVGGIECIDTEWLSSTSITCTTPPGAGGNKRVRVVIDSKYTATSPPGFSFSYSAPYVASVTPGSGSSQGGTRILIQGKNFGLTDSNPVAFVGPTRCQATTWTDDAAVTCLTPAWSEGPVVVPVTVRVFGQTSAETSNAVYQFGSIKSPTITSLAWSRAPTDGGFTITIYGSKFEDRGVKASIGKPGGGDQPCILTKWVSESKVTCKAPAGIGGHLPVMIESRDFPPASTFGSISFDYDPPEVTAVDPCTGAIGGGMRLTITGFGFGLQKTPVVGMIGNTACSKSTWTSDTAMSCTTPPGQGTHDPVRVKVGGQLSILRQGGPEFRHEGLAITGVSPSHGPTSGGTDITMYSADFGDNMRKATRPRAYIGVAGQKGYGTACSSTKWISATAISCTTPAGVGGALDVVVRDGGTNVQRADGSKQTYEGYGLFSYSRPVVTSVSPPQGNSAGGLPITILGTSFGYADTEPVAFVGDTKCERTLYVSDSSLVCVTPPGGGSRLGVRAVLGGQSSAPLASFNYDLPKVLYVEPTEGPVSGGSRMTIHGRNFGNDADAVSVAFVGPSPCRNTSWVSDRKLICTTPRGEDLYVRHSVLVKTEGAMSEKSTRAEYAFVEKRGADASGLALRSPEEDGLDSGSNSRAPGNLRPTCMYADVWFF
jgi:hypothetical protein